MFIRTFVVYLLLGFSSCAYLGEKEPEPTKLAPRSEVGLASYYGSEDHVGAKTASGETFDPNSLTAAHKSLPFGSFVEVTNLSNNRTVKVRINDRGPFVEGRIIDLSYAAAKQLDMLESGKTKVRLTYTQE